MPRIRKVQLDKAAWLWAESECDPKQISDNNIDVAYRGNIPKCKLGSCRRNCRGNPYCLSGLGESKWLSDNNDDSDEEDPDLQVRPPGTFVGLKNLGATCYVNSLVQLLFHNLAFRRAIFLWNPLEDPMEVENAKGDDETSKLPYTVVGHLQFLFGLMQFGKRKSIDPLDFIKALDLEPSMQQDAQEFSKLLFSLLEDSLNQQSDPKVKNLIIDYFRGEYSYITRCSKCQNDSVSPSMFYELELNIKGHKTLHESISEFLKEEKLDGVNMYSCSFCNEKQEATRFINLQKLPSVLNLQLMRFIYDRQKGHKKKISSSLQFPDTLDMSQYLNIPGKEKKPLLYNLTAVLIHKGPSANSGHYVAHICDQTTGAWYKFNDELVEKVEGKHLKLGSEEEDDEGAKKNKQPRLAKGFLESSNAYMLVYTAQSIQEITLPITEDDIRPELLKQVQASNEEFEKIITKTTEEKKIKKANILVHKAEMVSLLQSMPVETEGDRDWEAISCKWLSKWLSNTNDSFQPVNNSSLLCLHGKLHPDLVANAKYITTTAADVIYEKYGGGPRLPASEAICRECVEAKCRSIKFRIKLLEDAKDIAILLKQREEMDSGFWIGKRSLKGWRKRACAQFEGKEENCQNMKEVEDCPSPSSDNEASCLEGPSDPSRSLSECDPTPLTFSPDSSVDLALPPEKKCKLTDACPELEFSGVHSFHSMLDYIETVIVETKSKLIGSSNDLTSEFYSKWKKMDLVVRRICDPNLNCSPSVSKPAPVVSSTTTVKNISDNSTEVSVEMNGHSHNNGTDVKPKKRKLESQDKERDAVNGSEEVKSSNKSDEEDGDLEDFNEDIICQHNQLIPDESLRRLVSENIWKKFKYYFPEARDFPKDAEVCSLCKSMASQDQASLDLRREQAVIQKEILSSLLNGRNRPKLTSGCFRMISVTEFLRPWKKFVRECGRGPPLFSIRNSTLICVHGLLLYNPASSEDSAFLYAVTDDEWSNLQSFFEVDLEITVTYGVDESDVIETSPKLCDECVCARLASEQEALLQYDKAKLYIRRISNGKSSKKEEATEQQNEALSTAPAAKRTVLSKAGSSVTDNHGTEAIRRSTRHRRTPGDKEIIASSTDTVRDLKLKILNVLGVAPYDQHLSTEDGRALEDPTATLASMTIYPNSVLTLRVDEPPEDTSIIIDDYIRTLEPEAGFKGTVLQR